MVLNKVEINSSVKNDKLVLQVSGRIDSNNAKAVEDAFAAETSQNPGLDIILDTENLEYLSSAGLRVVLKLIKICPDLEIINVCTDVYEIFEMTGFTEMAEIKKAYRVFDVNDCKVIGEGAKGIVYRYNDDTIIKVYKGQVDLDDIQREIQLAHKAFVLGVPTAISYDIVKVNDMYGTVYELLDCKNLSQLIREHPENIAQYAKDFSTLLKTIHTTVVGKKDMPNIIDRVHSWLKTASSYLDSTTIDKINELIDDLMPSFTMIHGDFHTKNIMVQNGELLLIDMDTLSYGNPIVELAVIDFSYHLVNELISTNSPEFINISQEQAREFWKYFMISYFETEDQDKLKEIEEKIDLLAYIRVINHFAKRNLNPELINIAKNKIAELARKLDNLDI